MTSQSIRNERMMREWDVVSDECDRNIHLYYLFVSFILMIPLKSGKRAHDRSFPPEKGPSKTVLDDLP